MNTPVIGLFGSCGHSTWRDRFIATYEQLGLSYFNPQVAVGAWNPEQAQEEAWHLANDDLVLFPVTGDSLSLGSLAETGFCSQARWSGTRYVIIYVEPDVAPELYAQNAEAAAGSRRARALVRAHLPRVQNPNVFVVESLDAVLATSLQLYESLRIIHAARAQPTAA